MKIGLGQGILQALIKIIGQLKNTLGMRLPKIWLNKHFFKFFFIAVIEKNVEKNYANLFF